MLGGVSTVRAQSGSTDSDGDAPVHRVFLPSVSSGTAPVANVPSDTLIKIRDAYHLAQVLSSQGVAPNIAEEILSDYQKAHEKPVGEVVPAGFSYRPLFCIGRGAIALFDVGAGSFSANFLIPYPSGISGFCDENA